MNRMEPLSRIPVAASAIARFSSARTLSSNAHIYIYEKSAMQWREFVLGPCYSRRLTSVSLDFALVPIDGGRRRPRNRRFAHAELA